MKSDFVMSGVYIFVQNQTALTRLMKVYNHNGSSYGFEGGKFAFGIA